ncbi:3584_t:CDS:2, partial [Acaulospora morrowiae]
RPTSSADDRMGESDDPRPDHKIAKLWEKNRSHENIYLYKPKFINCETNNRGIVYDGVNRGVITINNSVLPKKVEKRKYPFGMELKERKKQVKRQSQEERSADNIDEIEDEPALEQKLSDLPEETTKNGTIDLNSRRESTSNSITNDNLLEVQKQTNDDDNEGNDHNNNSNISLVAQTQTETATTDNYDDGKKFVSSLAPRIEIGLGDFISNEERSNDELDAYVNETIQDGNKWIVCETDVRDLLIIWKQEKPRPRTDLAFYDIIDITPGSNSDFVQSLPNDAVQEMKQSKTFPTPNMDNVDEMKNYIIDFIKTDEFRNFVDESYLKTRVNNKTKFVWDYLNILVESFERDNDLTNYNLSELRYREIFFTPLIRSLFRCTTGK